MGFKGMLEKAGLWEGEEAPAAVPVPARPAPRPVSSRPAVTASSTSSSAPSDLAGVIESEVQSAAEPGLSKYAVIDGKYKDKVPDPKSRHEMVMVALDAVGIDRAQLETDVRESLERLAQLRQEADSIRDEELRSRVAVAEQRRDAAYDRIKALQQEVATLEVEARSAASEVLTEKTAIEADHRQAVGLIEGKMASINLLAAQIRGV